MLLKLFKELIFLFQAIQALPDKTFLFESMQALPHKMSRVIEKTIHIASSSYTLDQVTSVVWSDNGFEEATDFLIRFPVTVAVTSIQNGNFDVIRKLNSRVGYKQTVFFASDTNEFVNFLAVLKPDIVVPIKLVLVLTNRATDADISFVTKTALENDLADIVIVSTIDIETVELFTYFPYSQGICGNHAPINIHPEADNWFPQKFLNFQECPVRVALLSVLPYAKFVIENNTLKNAYGIDGPVFAMLMKELNASVDIVSWKNHDGVGTFINGTATGLFGDLVNKRADILAPTIIINYLRYQKAQISSVYTTIDVYWFGPQLREINRYFVVFQPLVNIKTLCTIGSLILFVVVTKLVIRFGRVHSRYGVIFQSFLLLIGQGVQFESKSWLINSLFVLWIWFSMIVRIVYQGDLVGDLQRIILESPFKNFEDAVRKVDGYGGYEGFREFYRETNYFDDFKVLRVEEVVLQAKNISVGKRFLLAADKLQITELNNALQMLKEPITHAPLCSFMRPGWPAAKNIADVIERLVEAGFTENIKKYHIYKWTREREHQSTRETHPLNMQIGCFYGISFLYAICAIFFTVEIVYHTYQRSTYSIAIRPIK